MAKIGKDRIEPTDKSYIGLRLNNNEQIVGYFKYENGQWIIIPRNKLKEYIGGEGNGDSAEIIETIVGSASENMDTLGEVEQSFLGLATVATTGDYNDLLNKPNQRTFKEFKSSGPTNSTLENFCSTVINDLDAKVGNAYLGGLSCTGLPNGMIQGDVIVEIIGTDNSNKVVKLTLTSTNLYPYHWEGCYGQGSFRGWKSFELISDKVTTIDENSTDRQYPSAKAIYDIITENELVVSSALNDLNDKLKPKRGTTAQIPTLESKDIGFMYFNTSIGLPIGYNGSNGVDATGTVVDLSSE